MTTGGIIVLAVISLLALAGVWIMYVRARSAEQAAIGARRNSGGLAGLIQTLAPLAVLL